MFMIQKSIIRLNHWYMTMLSERKIHKLGYFQFVELTALWIPAWLFGIHCCWTKCFWRKRQAINETGDRSIQYAKQPRSVSKDQQRIKHPSCTMGAFLYIISLCSRTGRLAASALQKTMPSSGTPARRAHRWFESVPYLNLLCNAVSIC